MRLGFVVLYTPDVAGLRAFYQGLGLKARADYGMWVEFETGPATLALHEAGEDEATRHAGVFLEVEDVDALYRRFKEKGLAVTEPRDQDFGFRTFTLRDPQGNLVEFGEPMQP
jgi:catechol 2,3-dioxygenase-like lactoylglutathione lyase family enzyme